MKASPSFLSSLPPVTVRVQLVLTSGGGRPSGRRAKEDLLLETAGSCQSHPCLYLRDSAQAIQGNKTESRKFMIPSVPRKINLNFSESVASGTMG